MTRTPTWTHEVRTAGDRVQLRTTIAGKAVTLRRRIVELDPDDAERIAAELATAARLIRERKAT
jgi:hypothetical protein